MLWNIYLDVIEFKKFNVFIVLSNFLKLLWVTIDDKLTFEKHIHNISSSITQKTSLIRKWYKTLGNNDVALKSFLHVYFILL